MSSNQPKCCPKVAEASRAECSYCGMEESSADEVDRHILMHHVKVVCDFCGITFPSLSEAQHHKQSKHKESKHKCSNCSMQFPGSEKLQKHLRECKRANTPCLYCGKMYRLMKSVNKHVQTECPAYRKCIEQSESEAPPPVGSVLSQQKCNICNEEFSCSGLLKRHLQVSHDLITCDICGITVLGVLSVKKHEPSCDVKLATEDHSSEASDTKCSQCGIEKDSADNLVRHNLTYHVPVACVRCGVTLRSLFEAQRHMKTEHLGWDRKCPKCSMQFPQRNHMKGHIARCEKETELCELCGKMFENKKAVSKHREKQCTAYRDGMEQKQQYAGSQIKCYYCIEEFSSPGHLNHHLQVVHELTKCDICGIIIFGISSVSKHAARCTRSTHPRGQAQECSTCGKIIYGETRYAAHRFRHNICSCKLCGHLFKRFRDVKCHNSLHHPGESMLDTVKYVEKSNDLKIKIKTEDSQLFDGDGKEYKMVALVTDGSDQQRSFKSGGKASGNCNQSSVQMVIANLLGCLGVQ